MEFYHFCPQFYALFADIEKLNIGSEIRMFQHFRQNVANAKFKRRWSWKNSRNCCGKLFCKVCGNPELGKIIERIH